MKFLTRINRNYLILFSAVLMAVTVADYFVLHLVIMHGAREKLIAREILVRQHILNTGEIPNLHPEVEVSESSGEPANVPLFREVTVFNPVENENEMYLEYSDIININDTWYSVKLRQALLENEDLILILALTIFILLSAAFIVSYFITRKTNTTVWADFEHNLHEIESFRLNQVSKINLVGSDTEEFMRLNRVISDLTEKLSSDYRALKEFTENASHEIQTPLTAALMNLEEILQDNLQEETFRKVTATIRSLKRLSSLNQSLILLTKIENRQFEPDTMVSLLETAKKKAEEFSAFIETGELKLKISNEGDFTVSMNSQLAEILIGNLLSNAINHNIKGGEINLSVNTGCFEICNTGQPNQLSDDTIFDRFTKGTLGSSGLGLAIARKICEIHSLDIHYRKSEFHCFYIQHKS